MKRAMTLADREAAGYDLTIWRAIQCAGGNTEVARLCEVSDALPRIWARKGEVPEEYREQICSHGGGIFTPDQLGAVEADAASA